MKIIKRLLLVLVFLITICVIYFFYVFLTFNIFEIKNQIIKEISVPNKKYNIRIYYIPSNATSQSYIQIRKYKDEVEEVIHNFETYNRLDKYYLKNDTLVIVISDTIRERTKNVKIKLP